jgi:ABC-type branched-subunit amino acid transport system ATPase component
VLLGQGGELLDIRELDVAYGHALALQGVNMAVRPGEMVFVVGRNGAGKTTLLKTICGLLAPKKGTICLEGDSIGGRPPEKLARKGIGFVAQDKKVFGELTVASNIELAAYAAGKPTTDAVETVLRLYPKMERFLHMRAGGLSGGQREILLIGRALVGDPGLLLIDEPTEGLAAVVINDIFRIISEMKSKRAAVIVEQNLSVVSRLADRVYIMKEGCMVREIHDREEIADVAGIESQL